MRTMSKIMLLTVFFTVGIYMNAQIRKTIMGVTIGASTKSAVFNKLTNQGYTFSEEPQALNIHEAEYAGYEWQIIKFCYLNNILYKVEFTNPKVPGESYWMGNVTPQTTIFENIKIALSSKYSRYLKNGIFSDGTTQIKFSKGQMIYENVSRAKKAENAKYDDL